MTNNLKMIINGNENNIPIILFTLSSSGEEMALQDTAIGGLYATIDPSNNIDDYFSLVRKQVEKVIVSDDEGNVIYESNYWNYIASITGSFDKELNKIIAILRITHVLNEEG